MNMIISIIHLLLGMVQLILAVIFIIKLWKNLFDKKEKIMLLNIALLSFSSSIFLISGILRLTILK